MPFLLSNNFEQIAGVLEIDEQKAIVAHYDDIDIGDITPPAKLNLRFPGLLSWCQHNELISNSYTSWLNHKAQWEADHETWLAHGVIDPDRLARLVRGENLYEPNDVAYDANERQYCWLPPLTPRTGWQYLPVLFWGGPGSAAWRLTNPSGTSAATYADAAAIINALPDGRRAIRVDNFPIYVRTILSPGGEIAFGWRNGHFDGGWPGLKYDDEWETGMRAIWEPWCAGVKAAGGDLEKLVYDFEARLGVWWIRNRKGYDYHPNYNPGTTGTDDLINDPQYDDTWLADNHYPNRARWNAMNTWHATDGDDTARFNASAGASLREAIGLITSIAKEEWPALRGEDYEDALFAGNVYPGNAWSYIGCGNSADGPDTPNIQNIYSGTSVSNNQQSNCFVPGTGTVTRTRRTQMRLTPTGITVGSALVANYEDYVWNLVNLSSSPVAPDQNLLYDATISYTRQAGDSTQLAVCQGFAAEWNKFRSRGYIQGIESGDTLRVTLTSPAMTVDFVSTGTTEYDAAVGFANAWNAASGHPIVDNSTATAVDLGSGQAYVRFEGTGNVESLVLSVINAGGSVTPKFFLCYDRVLTSFSTATAVSTGGGNGYVNIAMDSSAYWHHRLEALEGAVTGTGSVVTTIQERGSFIRMTDDYLKLCGMVAASHKHIAPWMIYWTDVQWMPFPENAAFNKLKMISYFSGAYGFLWNSNRDARGEADMVTIMDEVVAESNGIVGRVLPLETRNGYDVTTAHRCEKFAEGRIIVYRNHEDMTDDTHYQPTLAPIGDLDIDPGDELTFTAVGSDDDVGETLTYSLIGAPSGATIDPDTGEFSWTPTNDQIGEHPFIVWVEDDGPEQLGNGEHITVTVNNVSPPDNTPPFFDSGHDEFYHHRVGTLFSTIIEADDINGDDITFEIVTAGSPAGVAIDANSGVLTWTPTTAGTYLITVKITDNGSPPLSEQVGFYIKVENMPIELPGSIGPLVTSLAATSITSAPSTTAMAANNTGVMQRFRAIDSRDVKGAWIHWGTVSSPGEVTLEIQTLSNGLATGTKYDSNAGKAFTPAAGWQYVEFDVLPTTGLTPGAWYALVIRTTSAGTTQTLTSYWAWQSDPVFTATDADVSSYNFARVGSSTPIGSLVLEDNEEVSQELGWCPSVSTGTADQMYDDRWAGNKIVLPVGVMAQSVSMWRVTNTGTPGDLYVEVRDATGTLVPGCQCVMPFTNYFRSAEAQLFPFPEPVYLKPGTYYVGFWQGNKSADGDSSNRYNIDRFPIVRDASLLSGKYVRAFTTDINPAAVPTASTDRVLLINLNYADLIQPVRSSRMRGVNQL